jgi:hypothetical protein
MQLGEEPAGNSPSKNAAPLDRRWRPWVIALGVAAPIGGLVAIIGLAGSSAQTPSTLGASSGDRAGSLAGSAATVPQQSVTRSAVTPSTDTTTTISAPSTTLTTVDPAVSLPSTPSSVPLATTTTTTTTTGPAEDAATCPIQGDVVDGVGPISQNSVVPPGPASALVCEYSWNQVGTTIEGTLTKSSLLIAGQSLTQLVGSFDSSIPAAGQTTSSTTSTTTTNPAEAQVGTAPVEEPPEFEVIFSYGSAGVVGFGVAPDSPWGLSLLTPNAASPTEFWVPASDLVSIVSSDVG